MELIRGNHSDPPLSKATAYHSSRERNHEEHEEQQESSKGEWSFNDFTPREMNRSGRDGGVSRNSTRLLATAMKREWEGSGWKSPVIETPVNSFISSCSSEFIVGGLPGSSPDEMESHKIAGALPSKVAHISPSVEAGNICVVVRLRPRCTNEQSHCCAVLHPKGIVKHISSPRTARGVNSGRSSVPNPSLREAMRCNFSESRSVEDEERQYTFDAALDESASQKDTMTCVGYPLLQRVLLGFNGTILCYGQSGSGKTHTILGPPSKRNGISPKEEEIGLLPRMLNELFHSLNEKYAEVKVNKAKVDSENWLWQIELSAVELYQEELLDLLFALSPRTGSECDGTSSCSSKTISRSPSFQYYGTRNLFSSLPSGRYSSTRTPHQPELHIRDVGSGVSVEGLTWHGVCDASEAMRMINMAMRQRHVGATALNAKSSRSHVLFFVRIKQRDTSAMAKTRGGECGWVQSLLTFVDLAGSERVAATGAKGVRLREAQRINPSLLHLGKVIRRLSALKTKKVDITHIPFRDSKLTQLLRESIGGTAITVLLGTVSPDTKNATESLLTLNFAAAAKSIQNRPVRNRVHTMAEMQAMLLAAQRRIAHLEQERDASERRYLEQEQEQQQKQQYSQGGGYGESGLDVDSFLCSGRSTRMMTPKPLHLSQDYIIRMGNTEVSMQYDFSHALSNMSASQAHEIQELRATLEAVTKQLQHAQAELALAQSQLSQEHQMRWGRQVETPQRREEEEEEQDCHPYHCESPLQQHGPQEQADANTSILEDGAVRGGGTRSSTGWRHVPIPPAQTPILCRGPVGAALALLTWIERVVDSVWLRNTVVAVIVQSLQTASSPLPLRRPSIHGCNGSPSSYSSINVSVNGDRNSLPGGSVVHDCPFGAEGSQEDVVKLFVHCMLPEAVQP